MIDEVESSPKPIILFIDEAHTLIGAGGAAGTGDAANLLKPALARGQLRTIAATTWAEYRQYFEKDPALTRRFQTVNVGEPETDKAIAMIRSVSPMMEKHHGVIVLDEAVESRRQAQPALRARPPAARQGGPACSTRRPPAWPSASTPPPPRSRTASAGSSCCRSRSRSPSARWRAATPAPPIG